MIQDFDMREGRARVVPLPARPLTLHGSPLVAVFQVFSFVMLSLVSCSQSSTVEELQLLGSVLVSNSLNHDLSLVTNERACLIDSYEIRIHCYDYQKGELFSVGEEGEGPGEFRAPADLEWGPRGELAVVDYRTHRLTMYRADGKLKKTLPVPPIFRPLRSFTDSLMVGLYETWSDSIRTAPVAWVSMTGDSVLSRRIYRHLSEATKALGFGASVGSRAQSTDGRFVFWIDGYTLALYNLNGSFLGEFTSPLYKSEPMTERDLEEYAEGARAIGPGFDLSQEQLRERAEKPRFPLVRGAMRFDSAGRLWVATTRDHEAYSYFDLFLPPDFIGSVRVRDRVLGFDVHGSTLAVLVERSDLGSDGMRSRAIDWYEIEY